MVENMVSSVDQMVIYSTGGISIYKEQPVSKTSKHLYKDIISNVQRPRLAKYKVSCI